MNFETLLQKRFGLKGNLCKPKNEIERIRKAKNFDDIPNSDWEPKDDFTTKGWNAWDRLLQTLDEMVGAGIMTETERGSIADRCCDHAWDSLED